MNIGLIGCGNIAKEHMHVYQKIKDARIVAVSDINLEKAKNFAEKYAIGKFFSDYADLLEIKDIDFVDVCTPTSTHATLVCDAAQFGRNVLVEKPMALSTDECDKMILTSKKHRVKLCICHNQRFFSAVNQAKSMIDSGNFELVSFKTLQKGTHELYGLPAWNITPEERGVLWEVAYHLAYLQLHFLKGITEVYALGSKFKYPVFDHFSVLLKTPNRTFGNIEVSWISEHEEIAYEISSSNGKIFLIDRYNDTLIDKSCLFDVSLRADIRRVLRHFNWPRKTVAKEFGYYTGHYYLINEYIKSLKNDADPPVPPEEGKRTIKLLECIEESLDKHKIVQIR